MNDLPKGRRTRLGVKLALLIPGGKVPTPKGAMTSRMLERRVASLLVPSLALPAGEILGQSLKPTTQSTGQSAEQRDLSQDSPEDLMNIEVTPVSKKEQNLQRGMI
jgi:hypothetical protein